MSAVSAPLFPAARHVVEHPWVKVARVDAPLRPGDFRTSVVRIVPNEAGVDALCAHGKSYLVDVLHDSHRELPDDPRQWRVVDRLDATSADQDDFLNRPRVRAAVKQSEAALDATLFVPYDLRVFEGHFHDVPLVPGVLQVAWALGLAEGRLAGIGRFHGIISAKFRRLVRPGMELQLSLQWLASNRELQFAFRHGTVSTSNGRLRMTGADD